ncbi:hypothetical protein FEM48_Zijuj03G0075500 [Ziziphus jujuba var. spinosa]|uniref:Uncharacterized protein n=1 Tax=Ziziphus jujuba var. spinosa TaxID=714518 RepID=A0A978VP00_ZIZJJ|nr:hypothetical protein FEM48_Zijuj03G0075500 [Ziziphus jujuba var. spinosa]
MYLLMGISLTTRLFCSNFPSKPIAQKLYLCPRLDYRSHEIPESHKYVASDPQAWYRRCKNNLSSELIFVATDYGLSSFYLSSASSEERYVKGAASYMVMDDLQIEPLSVALTLAVLTSFNVTHVGILEEKIVSVGIDEAYSRMVLLP